MQKKSQLIDHEPDCSRYTTVLADSVPGLCNCGFEQKTTLKACPYCGTKADVADLNVGFSDWAVFCKNGHSGPLQETRAAAIREWNKRV